MNIDLSICIVSYQACGFLDDCLRSIHETAGQFSFEVIVVDNHSMDGTVEMLKDKFPDVRLLANDHNTGYTRPNNQAMRESKGRYILLLNPDTLVKPNALAELYGFLEAHPEIGIAGPKVFNRDGTLQKQCRRSEARPWDAFCYFSGLSRLFPKDRRFAGYLMTYLDEDLTHEADAVSGSCMMIRRKVIDQIGYQDELFFAYQEDTDYCRRARLAGWKVFYDPSAQIIHFAGEGGSRVQPFRSILEWHRSYYLYYRKHFEKDYPAVLNGVYYLGMLMKLGLSLFVNIFYKRKVVGTRKP
jgi:GT2 family glycosyltransferase